MVDGLGPNLPAPAEPLPPEFLEALRLAQDFIDGLDNDNTRQAYRRDLQRWFQWCLDRHLPPLEAKMSHVLQWSAELERAGDANTTRARRLTAISSWYRLLCRDEIIDRNPADLGKQGRPAVDRMHSDTVGLTRGQATRLQEVADADSPSSAATVAVLLDCALRVGELCRADIEDLAVDRGHHILLVTRKGGRRQKMVVPPATYARLETHHAARPNDVEKLPALEPGSKPRRPLVTTADGLRLNRGYVRRLLRRLAREAGGDLVAAAERLHPHAIRHTTATELLNAGVPIRDVQDLLGHRDINTTRRYDRDRENLERSAAYRAAALFTPVTEDV